MYENRQHSLGRIICSKDYNKSLLTQIENEEAGSAHSDEETNARVTQTTPKPQTKKKVTFASGKDLVRIREIPARPVTPTWSGNEESETDSGSSTSSSDDSDSQDEEVTVDEVTTSLPIQCSLKPAASIASSRNPVVSKGSTPVSGIARTPPRRPARKSRLDRRKGPSTNQPVIKPTFLRDSVPRRRPFISFSATSRRYSDGDNIKSQKPAAKESLPRPHTTNSYMLRIMGTTTPKLNMSYRARQSEDDSNLLAKRKSIQQSPLTNIPPQNDRYNRVGSSSSISNSGEERTKFYAWQVANGAPLITTPGIAPLYSEHVTLTKL